MLHWGIIGGVARVYARGVFLLSDLTFEKVLEGRLGGRGALAGDLS